MNRLLPAFFAIPLLVCIFSTLSGIRDTSAESYEPESRDYPPKTAYYNVRNNIPNCFYRFTEDPLQQNDYRGQMVFYGGDSLKDKQPNNETTHADELLNGFKKLYPDARISLNRHPAPMGSWYGAFRVARAVPVYGETIFSATLAVLDFVPEDADLSEQEITDSWEGMIRAVLTYRPDLDVMLIYRPNPGMIDDYLAGKTPAILPCLEKIADHYGLPSLNLARYVADKVAAGTLNKNELFAEGANAGPAGEAIFAEAVWNFVNALDVSQPEPRALFRYRLPEPISATHRQQAKIVDYETATCSDGWTMGKESPIKDFRHVLVGDKPGAELSLVFQGVEIGLMDVLDDRSPDYEYGIDGGGWKKLEMPVQASSEVKLRIIKIAAGLDPKKEHTLKLRIASGQNDKIARVGAFLLEGNVTDPYAGLSPLEKADAIYAAMSPIAWEPPNDRWKYLPKTMEKLKNGESLRIVLLGDSIIGDTSSSQFELVLQREYPNCKIEKILSNRSSTGCRWYKEENRVEQYVLKYEPDLLIVGGISNGDAESVRSVIQQVREKQSPEIALMTPVFGAVGDGHLRNWTFEPDMEKFPFRAELKKVAEEESCEFIDLTGVTWQYMQNSGKCYGWFMRDYVHANERGFQVIGRPLVRYFLTD